MYVYVTVRPYSVERYPNWSWLVDSLWHTYNTQHILEGSVEELCGLVVVGGGGFDCA